MTDGTQPLEGTIQEPTEAEKAIRNALSAQWATSNSLINSGSDMHNPFSAVSSLLSSANIKQCHPASSEVLPIIEVHKDVLTIKALDGQTARRLADSINALFPNQAEKIAIAPLSGAKHILTRTLQINLENTDKDAFTEALKSAEPSITNRVTTASLPTVQGGTSVC